MKRDRWQRVRLFGALLRDTVRWLTDTDRIAKWLDDLADRLSGRRYP